MKCQFCKNRINNKCLLMIGEKDYPSYGGIIYSSSDSKDERMEALMGKPRWCPERKRNPI